MSLSTSVRQSVILGGLAFSANKLVAFDEGRARQVSLAAAKPGQLTTRTDDNTGTLTMEAGHAIATGNTVDIYWDGGSRRDVTVGTVAGDSVPIDLGAGDNLPANLTEVTVQVVSVESFIFEADEAEVIAVYNAGNARAQVRFHDSGGEELALELESKSVFVWADGSGFANPLSGDSVIEVHMTQENPDAAADIRVGVAITN